MRYDHSATIACENGPLLLRGSFFVVDSHGNAHRTYRPVSALCRCGKSGLAPWCDGTHQLLSTASATSKE